MDETIKIIKFDVNKVFIKIFENIYKYFVSVLVNNDTPITSETELIMKKT